MADKSSTPSCEAINLSLKLKLTDMYIIKPIIDKIHSDMFPVLIRTTTYFYI